jgi:hypothetical protein
VPFLWASKEMNKKQILRQYLGLNRRPLLLPEIVLHRQVNNYNCLFFGTRSSLQNNLTLKIQNLKFSLNPAPYFAPSEFPDCVEVKFVFISYLYLTNKPRGDVALQLIIYCVFTLLYLVNIDTKGGYVN